MNSASRPPTFFNRFTPDYLQMVRGFIAKEFRVLMDLDSETMVDIMHMHSLAVNQATEREKHAKEAANR